MPIGMIGGIGAAATEFYYRNLVAVFRGGSSKLDLTIVHADVDTLVANITSGAEVVLMATIVALQPWMALGFISTPCTAER